MDDEKGMKGFAGLSSLTSKIEDRPAPSRPEQPSAPKGGQEAKSERTPEPPRSPKRNDSKSHFPKPKKSGSGSSGWKWSLGIVGVIVVVAVYSSYQRSKPYVPPASNTPKAATSNPVWNPTPSKPPTPGITFAKPPVGRDNILSVEQIRWCQREDIRLDVQKPLLNTNAQIDSFNRGVDDYNQRCGSYRYRSGTLERAKREVEKLRSEIEIEARRAIQATFSGQSSQPVVAQPSSRPTSEPPPSPAQVREVQSILTQLGYKPGPVDGQFGTNTENAIRMFQTNSGYQIDGKITDELLKELRHLVSLE